MRKVLQGPFSLDAGAATGWRLHTTAGPQRTVYLRAPSPPAGVAAVDLSAAGPAAAVTIDWRPAGAVEVQLQFADRTVSIGAAEARIHESAPELYRILPLAAFDAAARAFWRKVFFVVRLPGGRWLLQAWARRARAPR